jgi:AraC-like DNA-binding protein
MHALNIKAFSKESFLVLLSHIIDDVGVRDVFFSQKTPTMHPKSIGTPPEARIDITLSGKKHMIFPDGDNTRDMFLLPGQMHYSPPMYWKLPLWDSFHEMSSIVIRKDIIRLTYIKHDKTNSSCSGCNVDVFYHTNWPICDAGAAIVKSLNALADTPTNSGAEKDLLNGLLKLIFQELKTDQPKQYGKAHLTWLKASQYLHENFYYPINRAHVASIFKLNPSHLSRLFAQEGKEGFNATLQRLRMEHAVLLLKNTNMTLDEITDKCGYISTTSLIATFKKHFGLTPGVYRTRDEHH